MGMYKYVKEAFKKPNKNPEQKNRLIQWRKQNTIVRISKPTKLTTARSLGYKAKQGVIIARVRIRKGGRKRMRVSAGRKPKRMGKVKYSPKKSFQTIAEQRAVNKFVNLRVVNSYEAGDDGKSKWFEVIMIDPNHPQVYNDKDLSPLTTNKHQGRVHRGLTSSGKKARGLNKKGKGSEKNRPSIKSNKTRGK